MSVIIDGEKFPNWINDLITLKAFSNKTTPIIAKELDKSVGIINKYMLMPEIKKAVIDTKQERIDKYKNKMYLLIDDAFEALQELVKNGKKESVKLEASKLILKKFDILNDSQTLELKQADDTPFTFNIVSTPPPLTDNA